MQARPPQQDQPTAPAAHEARAMAESFGTDAAGYDSARPGYPEALVSRVLAGSPGRTVLDVGCGTGIASRQFQSAGCAVLGIDPDARMAEFARTRGLKVEVATFESWDPGGRGFDVVIAAQSWHWINPIEGAVKAAQVLRPRGRLAVFGHVYEPPDEVAGPFAAAYREVVPESPFGNQPARRPLEMYQALYASIADAIRNTEQFDPPQHWTFEWERVYTRDAWLALLPTTGGLTQLPPDKRAAILEAVGQAIDGLGGTFTMHYTTLAATAVRASTD
jgi:SAM-dependent methyltransferase